jgi:hypothetical protein
MAFPAATLKDNKTSQGDVIVETDRSFATGAMRGGCDDGFALRDAVYADIEKAPDDGSKSKAEKKRHPAH